MAHASDPSSGVQAGPPSIRPADEPAALDAAEAVLRAGGCVALPTETVYGLACDATNGQAVAGVYAAKGRPSFNPLIAHVDGMARAERLVRLDPVARRLAEAIWPGPLTIVAPIRPDAGISALAAAGLDTLAVRWPAAPAMTTLIARLDRPLAAPSANRSGAVSPTRASHVAESLGARAPLILDGGPCPVGVESAIVSALDGRLVLLRPGGLTRAAIEAAAGQRLETAQDGSDRPGAPGQLASHYAPDALIRLDAAQPRPDEAFLSFGPAPDWPCRARFDLSPSGDLREAAARLFDGLRALDGQAARIAVSPVPDTGLGEAINDRLRRAAAPR